MNPKTSHKYSTMHNSKYHRHTEPISTIWGNIGAKGDLVRETVGNRKPWFLKQGRGVNAVMTLWGQFPLGQLSVPTFRTQTIKGKRQGGVFATFWGMIGREGGIAPHGGGEPYTHLYEVLTIWGKMPLMVPSRGQAGQECGVSGRDLCVRRLP